MSTAAKRRRPPEDDPLRRPFSRRVMQRARTIADCYQIKLWREDGHWFGVGVEEPGTYGDGRTLQQCVRDVREALAITVAHMIEMGGGVVEPIVDGERRRGRHAG